jgi:hypothetical protein
MMIVGYAKVSTDGQQHTALREAGAILLIQWEAEVHPVYGMARPSPLA